MRRERGSDLSPAALDAMRDAARKAVESTTLNAVARKARVDSKALGRFLQRGVPSLPTQAKLLDWYLGTAWAKTEDTARCALGVLLAHTAPGAVQRTARELLEVIGRAPGGRPPWLRDLLAEVTDEKPGGSDAGADGEGGLLVPVHVVRSAVREAVEGQSARKVAASVGISVNGLLYFLAGGEPHRRTLRKLLIWYSRHGSPTHGQLTEEVHNAAMDALLELVPPDVRERTRRDLIAVLASISAR